MTLGLQGKSWCWLVLRVLLAAALVLGLARVLATDAVAVLKPALRWGLEQAAPDFQVLRFDFSTDRGQPVLAALVRQQRTLFLGGRAVVPEPHSISGTGANVATVLQPVMVAVVLLLAWPARRWLEWPWRLLLATPLLALVLMLDTPLSMAAWLWFAQVKQHEPGAFSALLWWNTFLGAGGRLALGLVAAALALFLAQRVAGRTGRGSKATPSEPTAATPGHATGVGLSKGICVVLALGCAGWLQPAPVRAATPVPGSLLETLAQGEPVDVIVEVEATTAERDAATRRQALPLGMDNAATSAQLAAAYAQRKAQVLGGLQRADLQLLRDYSHLPQLLLRVQSAAALRALAALPGVRALYVQQVHQAVLAQSLPLIGQPAAALAGLQGSGATVAVIDDGIDLFNPAFGGCTAPGLPASCRVVANPTFVTGATPNTSSAHGTNVAATVLGVAPQARVAAINVFRSTGGALTSDIISGINWAIANRATFNIVAINMSLGDSSRNANACAGNAYATPVTSARNAGMHVVVAAGNAGFSNGVFVAGLASPACTPGVVSVGAVYDSALGGLIWSSGTAAQCTDGVTTADQVACFSMAANYLSLLAPGALTVAGGITQGGTSQASPHVAGALAVLRAAYTSETLAATEARLQTGGATVLDTRSGLSHRRLSLSASARPANDDFAGAATAAGASGAAAGSNALATVQVGEPTPVSGSGQSVWWQWTAPGSGQVTLDTTGSGFDTGLSVFTGATLNALSPVASNDNASVGVQTSRVRFQAQSAITYRWAVTGVGAAAGSITLNWALNTAAQANLALTASGPATVGDGATAVFNLALSNSGPQAATAVLSTLTLPVGLAAGGLPAGCSATVSLITCSVGELAAGATFPLALPLVNTGLAGLANLTATISGAVPDPVAGNNSVVLSLAPSTGAADAGDIPTLPTWALLGLGAGLLWRLRRHRAG
jgi:subtilisin family serine protease